MFWKSGGDEVDACPPLTDTLTTTSGIADSYVAEGVKAVICQATPGRHPGRITHQVYPATARRAVISWHVVATIPAGDGHLAIVGSGRREIATLCWPRRRVGTRYVATDKGSAVSSRESRASSRSQFLSAPPPKCPRPRDVFAPAAAAIASGKVSRSWAHPHRRSQSPLPLPITMAPQSWANCFRRDVRDE